MDTPGGFGDLPQPGVGVAAGGVAAPAQGVWDQHVIVNTATSITCVSVPFYDDKAPLQGTKPARVLFRCFEPYQRGPSHLFVFVTTQESFLAALKARCGGTSPLNLRTAMERDKITPDPYYVVAPGQSTLGWSSTTSGVKPAPLADYQETVVMVPGQHCLRSGLTVPVYLPMFKRTTGNT